MKRKLTIKEILDYEVKSNKLIPKISNNFLQNIIGRWIGRKGDCERKFKIIS